MTLEKALTTDRTNDSIVGLVVWYNMLQIRQRLIDEYWWHEIREQDLATGKKRETLKSMSAKARAEFLYDVAPLVHNEYIKHPELGRISFSPAENNPLPISLQTKEEFAANTGIGKTRYKELEALHQIPNVEELVAIARIGDVDLAYMFMPTMEILESDDTLILAPINGLQVEVPAFRWVLWVRSLLQLPGQSGKKFLSETSMPSMRRESVDGRSAKRTTVKVEAEIKKRSGSSVSALDAIKDDFQSLKITLALDPEAQNPFQNASAKLGYNTNRGVFITKHSNKLYAHLRMLISLSRVHGKSEEVLFARFTKGAKEAHVLENLLVNRLRIINFTN